MTEKGGHFWRNFDCFCWKFGCFERVLSNKVMVQTFPYWVRDIKRELFLFRREHRVLFWCSVGGCLSMKVEATNIFL